MSGNATIRNGRGNGNGGGDGNGFGRGNGFGNGFLSGERIRAALLAGARGLVLAPVALVGGIVFLVTSVLSIAFIVLGIGLFATPWS